MSYDNTNRGALFKNDRKQSDSHPDYTGKLDVGGTEYWLSAWIKEGAKGKYMSVSVKPKDEQRAPSQSRQQPATTEPEFDDDIPF